MFEYDRLALDVAEQFTSKPFNSPPKNSYQHSYFDSLIKNSRNTSHEEIPRRLSGGSCSNDAFDCGSSSGYGSPGLIGTPLASPSPNVQCLATQLHKMLMDQGYCEENHSSGVAVPNSNSLSSSINSHSPRSYELLAFSNSIKEAKTSPFGAAPKYHQPSPLSISIFPEEVDKNAINPVAVEDGFSNDEIAQFAELLCSPKKAPPVRYQCHICYQTGHYISDCPMRFNSPYEELTPYQGRKKCYGEFQCQQCKRKWTSQNSVANEAQSCIKCHISVFPHKQLPVDKAVALGLVKAQKPSQAKMAPIGHGRPPLGLARN